MSQTVSDLPLLSQLLQSLSPGIRSSLGELQGTLHLIAHDLEANSAADDLARAATELHGLCGKYRTYGFDEIGHLCQALEESCSATLPPQPDALARLSSLATQVKISVEDYRTQLSA